MTSPVAKIRGAAKVLALLLVMATMLGARALEGSAEAGVQISNRAEATYVDATGVSYATVSPTIVVTVLAVATVVVTPDETASSDTVAPHDQVTRLFRVCNTGNNADTFSISRFDLTAPATLSALYFDNDASAGVNDGDTLIAQNQTASPQLPPRGCMGVLAVINTNDIAAKSLLTLTLTARSNATNAVNGRGQDVGTIINAVGLGARLTDPADPNHGPSKLINGLAQTVVSRAGEFTYVIAFKNSGDTAARNVLVQDHLPSAIEYLPGSLQLNERSLSDALDNDEGSVQGGDIKIQLSRVNPGESFRISFRARLTSGAPAGTGLVNTATLSADNAPQVVSTRATAIIDPFGVVFAGRGGSATPIAGARVEIVTDQNNENLLPLPSDNGFAPNQKNENPFVSDAQGHFSFVPGTNPVSTNYFMKASANGYMDRLLQLSLRPTQSDLFSVTVHALDNQPLAAAGGFALVHEDVSLADLAALVLNVPMFEPAGLQIIKSTDRAQAEIGDIVTYRIEVHNPTSASVKDVVISDRLPTSFHYADGSARLSLAAGSEEIIQPQINDGELQFHIAEIPHGATAKLLYRVLIGANALEGDQANTAVASGLFLSGERTTSAVARAVVRVSAGVFSTRQVIVGRVFVDTNGNNQFDQGDRPMLGVPE